MTLSTTPSWAAPQQRVNVLASDIAAVVCATSAGVHAALVVPHAEESSRMAAAFALSTVALAAAAVILATRPSPAASAAVAGLLLSVAAAYFMSRTTGIPGLNHHQEPVDVLGVLVTSLEVAGAAVVLWPLTRRSN
ncbi:MAG TPA: hypothetical protein VFK41_06840 [Nocardioidaceae bacterium]|nr:hypothetical protein [Nocardioidaceae bacterium]